MTATERDKILDDLRKLTTARDRAVNPNEAAAAAAIISRLLLKHQLSEDEVLSSTTYSVTDPVESAEVPIIRTNGEQLAKVQNWQTQLLAALCRTHMCSLVFRTYPMRGVVFGRRSAVLVVQHMFVFLNRTLQNVAKAEKKRMRQGGEGKRNRDWWVSWYVGAVNTVAGRLADERRAAEQTSTTALVLVRRHEAEALALRDRTFPRLVNAGRGQSARHSDGFSRGAAAGRNIPLRGAVEGPGSSQRQLI